LRPGKRRTLGENRLGRMQEQYEQAKACIRARLEHPFHLLKNILGLKKVRYRCLG
jgi:IS5 family transposase